MAKLYERFERIEWEISTDPHSLRFQIRATVDPVGDPLDLLMRVEEGDEEAVEIFYGVFVDRKPSQK